MPRFFPWRPVRLLALVILAAVTAGSCRLSSPAPAPPDTPLGRVRFTAFDLETTGLSAESGRIVEIAAVRFHGGRVGAARSWLINPGMPIPAAATRVHGITDDMVRDAPSLAAVLPEFLAFTRGTVLVAHNAPFDLRFLRRGAARVGCALPDGPVVDTLRLARKWFPGEASYSLATLADRLGLPPDQPHRAADDAGRAARLFIAGAATLPPDTRLGDL